MAKSRKTKAKYKDFQKVKLKVNNKFLKQLLNPHNTSKPLKLINIDNQWRFLGENLRLYEHLYFIEPVDYENMLQQK